MLDAIETTAAGLTTLCVTTACLAVLAAGQVPLRTGYDASVADSIVEMSAWQAEQSGAGAPIVEVIGEIPSAAVSASRLQTNASSTKTPATGPDAQPDPAAEGARGPILQLPPSALSVDWFGGERDFPPEQSVPEIPWLKLEPGVTYHRPKAVHPLLVERYRSLEPAIALMKEPRGEFVATAAGSAFRLSSLPKTSHLSRVVGLQPGDVLLSVNGHTIDGVGITAAKALYEQIKDASRFAVKVRRGGTIQVLTFTVDRR